MLLSGYYVIGIVLKNKICKQSKCRSADQAGPKAVLPKSRIPE